MSDFNDEYRGGSGLGSALLLAGVALGAAAAFLLGTKPGQQVSEQITSRAGEWQAQAAEALAQGREKIIASVEEQQSAPAPPGPGPSVRERPS